jgi:hypothetical protein
MKTQIHPLRFLGLALALSTLGAQPILYHEAQDKKAQSAEAAAKQITNGAVFDKEIQNLDALSKLEIERVLSFAQVQFKAGVNAFITWKDVSDQLDKVNRQLTRRGMALTPEEAQQQLGQVKTKVDEVQASIRKLQASSTGEDTVLKEIQANLNTASDVLGYADQLPIGDTQFSAAIEHIKAGLDTAKSLYDSFEGIFAARNDAKAKLAKLNSPVEADELRLLRLEMQHLQWIAQNSARGEFEAGFVIDLVDAARNKLVGGPRDENLTASSERVEATLEKLAETARSGAEADRFPARQRLRLLLIALHEAAAARAQFDLPKRLAELRDTQEEARYSILRSAARVESSQELIQSATSRLALYYQGGIKPAQVAQLLYNLSGLITLPIIATK